MNIILTQDFYNKNNSLVIISLISLFFGVYTIISKNPIVSVLFLIGLFCSIALYLIMIDLQFIGLSYLLIYVGAVSILFLFILMLINIRVSELVTDNRNSITLAILTIIAFNYTLGDSLFISSNLYNIFSYLPNFYSNFWFLKKPDHDIDILIIDLNVFSYIGQMLNYSWENVIIVMPHIAAIGNILYSNLFILFILTSFILLLAMVGAIIITINKSNSVAKPSPFIGTIL